MSKRLRYSSTRDFPTFHCLRDLFAPSIISPNTPLPVPFRLSEGIRTGLIAMSVGYVVTLLGAVPMHVSFMRRGWKPWWAYALLGTLLGIIPWPHLWPSHSRVLDPARDPLYALTVLIGLGAACGASAATVFWPMAVKQ